MTPSTPKFKSKDFKTALAGLKSVFDATGLAIVLGDALERRAAEQICARMKAPQPGQPMAGRGPARGGRVKDLDREKLVERIVEVFFTDDEVAFQTMKELDRACSKERHMVASIPEEQASDRIGSYRAMALARERARMTWALARDERAAVREVANRVVVKLIEDAAQLETARAVLEGGAEGAAASEFELAKKLEEQASRLTDAAERVTSLESKVSRYEEERARLLAQIGAKERGLRQESQAREQLDEQLSGLRAQLQELESKEAQAEQAIESEAEARAAAEELQQKVRRLSKLAGASKSLSAVQEELERAKKRNEELERRAAQAEAETARAAEAAEKEQVKLRSELEELREELKTARRRVTELERRAPAESEGAGPEAGSIAILLDQANLAATASMAHRRKVNFTALLEELSVGKKRRKAVAFVVDNGGVNFDAFCETLRRSGWELRVKKPKLFSDGTSKADWDMGIAVEAVELRGQVETLFLVSGDGDFAPLVKLLKRWGMRVEIAAFPEGLAADLQNVADDYRLLGAESLE